MQREDKVYIFILLYSHVSLEKRVESWRRVLLGALVLGGLGLHGCSKDGADGPVSSGKNHCPTYPSIRHTIVDDYSGEYERGVSMVSYQTMGIWVESKDADGDNITYFWNSSGGKFLSTDFTYDEGPYVIWEAPHVEFDKPKDFFIRVYASDGGCESDWNGMGIIVSRE